MKHTVKLFFLLVPVIALTLIPGCTGIDSSSWSNNATSGAYSNTYLPDKFSINIPSSIKSQNTSLKKTGIRETSNKELSYGYKHLKDHIKKLEQFSAGFELQFMLIDKIYGNLDEQWNNQQQNNILNLPQESLEVEFTKDISEKFVSANANLDMTLRDYLEMKDIVGSAVGDIFKIPKKPVVDPYHVELNVSIPAGSIPADSYFYISVSGSATAISDFILGEGYWDGTKVSYVYFWGEPDQIENAVILDDMYAQIAGSSVSVKLPETIFIYEKDVNDTNKDSYHHIITYSGVIGPDVSHLLWDIGKKTTKIKWSTDRNKIAVIKKLESADMEKTIYADSDFSAGKMSVKITEKYKGNFGSGEFSISVNLEETGENNGVKISSKEIFKNGTTQDTYEISGKADDNGGFIVTTFKMTDSSTGNNTKYTYKESFNSKGELTGLSSDDPSTQAYNIGDPTQSEYFDTTGETYIMEDSVYITVAWPADLSTQLTTISTNNNITIDDFFNYVIVLNTAPDPAVNQEEFMSMQIGYGHYNKTDKTMRWTDYWGSKDQIALGTVYLEWWKDSTQEFIYVPISSATLIESTEAPAPPPVNEPVNPTDPNTGGSVTVTTNCPGFFVIMPDGSYGTSVPEPPTTFFDAQIGSGQMMDGTLSFFDYWGTPEQTATAKVYCEILPPPPPALPEPVKFDIDPAATITVN